MKGDVKVVVNGSSGHIVIDESRPSAVHWPTTQCGLIRDICGVLCPD